MLGEYIDFLVDGIWFEGFESSDWIIFYWIVGSSILMAWVARFSRLSSGAKLESGRIYQVLLCFGFAMLEYWGKVFTPAQIEVIGFSWVSVIVIFFAVVVPSVPGKALLTVVASVATVPAAAVLSVKFGGGFLGGMGLGQAVTSLSFRHAIIAILAYSGTRVVYKLGTEVSKARRVGSYRLVETLGQGGMGEVWRANHRLLSRPAAVKLIRPEVLGDHRDEAGQNLIARFEREAQTTSLLRSPHTVELYDFGSTDDHRFYYVMELLEGFDCDTLVRRSGPLPPERTIHILKQVCHSLGEAHAANLIHRDIKPANIFVAQYGREVDFVKVLDFGLVKTTEIQASDVTLTAQQTVGGTPAFMAPEQFLGRAVDARADIYALGCVAYWLLTGELVFSGDTPMEIMTQHASSRPVHPRERAELDLPEELCRIVLECLEKEPAERPTSVDQLLESLDMVSEIRPWTQARAKAWWEIHQPIGWAQAGIQT